MSVDISVVVPVCNEAENVEPLAREIEAARRAMTRYVKRGGQVWNRVFPDVPVSKKPLEVRMGSGKGSVEGWVAVVKPGRVLFEIAGVTEANGRAVAQKSP